MWNQSLPLVSPDHRLCPHRACGLRAGASVKHTYIHDSIIRDWLDGKPIQVQNPQGVWYTLDSPRADMMNPPQFAADCRYRVKPEEDPFIGLRKTFGSQCSCRVSDEKPVPVVLNPKELDESDVKVVENIMAGIEAHKLADNERGL